MHSRPAASPTPGEATLGQQNLVPTLEREVGAAVGNQVRVNVTGRPALDDALNVHSEQDATRAEITALPFLIVILLWSSGSVVAMAIPLNLAAASSAHSVNSVTPLLLVAVMFGLSVDYVVIMFARMREEHLNGRPHRDAVLHGLRHTAAMVNGGAVMMIAVFASFSTAQISIVQEIGIGLAVAVFLDAVLIRLALEMSWRDSPATASSDPRIHPRHPSGWR